MLIRIRFHDDTEGTVDSTELQTLIDSGAIAAFKRSSGWAQLGVDPVRRCRAERREHAGLVNHYV